MVDTQTRRKDFSFRKMALLILGFIALPLIIAVILFDWYTVTRQQAAVQEAYRNTLSAYAALFEDTLDTAEQYVVDASVNDLDFQSIVYARTKTQAYLSAKNLADRSKLLLLDHEMLGGFFIYSKRFDYHHSSCANAFAYRDAAVVREVLSAMEPAPYRATGWIPLALSDRTVLLCAVNNRDAVFAVVVDPSRQTYSELVEGGQIYYNLPDGTPMAAAPAVSGPETQEIRMALSQDRGEIVYAVPRQSFFAQLSQTQWILLTVTLLLLASIPACWLLLRNLLLQPIGSLAATTQAIQDGSTDTRVPANSVIHEMNTIAETVNIMLDTIQKQKIEAYEQQLEIQDAQVQYLRLQLRPHFFLNCLNVIYSLAGEKKYGALQELTLDLSVYLRSIFKNSARLVLLSEEIASVESYVRLRSIGMEPPPELDVFVSAEAAKAMVPPISVLTFVENAVKHAGAAPLRIAVQCQVLRSPEGAYLNITVTDNGGGFSPEALEEFQTLGNRLYTARHVGISNLHHRLRTLYQGRATLSFRNLSGGACVDLFLPID